MSIPKSYHVQGPRDSPRPAFKIPVRDNRCKPISHAQAFWDGRTNFRGAGGWHANVPLRVREASGLIFLHAWERPTVTKDWVAVDVPVS